MVRTGSVSSYMDDGYVPDYHTGRKMSAQYEVIFQKKSSRTNCFTLEMNSAPKNCFSKPFTIVYNFCYNLRKVKILTRRSDIFLKDYFRILLLFKVYAKDLSIHKLL